MEIPRTHEVRARDATCFLVWLDHLVGLSFNCTLSPVRMGDPTRCPVLPLASVMVPETRIALKAPVAVATRR